jgi:pimeloyl-ACP methyl ester carboxylesterase
LKKLFALFTAGLFALTLSGCAPQTPSPKDVFDQELAWSLCEDGVFQCAKVKVPIDWGKPDGKTFDLALIRKFTNDAVGSLVINPGGPGGSGYDFLANNWDSIGTPELRETYTLVSFDPRGVSRSAKVTCLDSKGTDELLYGSNDAEIGSDEEIELMREDLKGFIDACKENTGEVLGHIDTVSSAKDMDVIRAALGEDKLNYLGYSYGTFLGTTYAALFPDKVGRFVLDGAIDPRVPDEQQTLNQLAGFNLALNNYLKDCVNKNSDCPFTGTLEQAQQSVKNFLLEMEGKTLKTDSQRELTISSATTGLILALYSDTYWPYLSQAFEEAFDGDGSTFLLLADTYNDRMSDGSYNGNSLEANIAINCLDSRASSEPAAMAKQNQKLLKVSPILGRYWQNGALTCEQWPFPVAERPESYSAEGAPTIMVVGTTGDPATPFEQSVALAHEVLADGFLVTFRGEGHTAYGRSNKCVSDAVDDFLIRGAVPSKEPVC